MNDNTITPRNTKFGSDKNEMVNKMNLVNVAITDEIKVKDFKSDSKFSYLNKRNEETTRQFHTSSTENRWNKEQRPYQVKVEEALNYRVIDLFNDSDHDKRLISRADIVLIMTLYKNGFEEFLEDYKKYAYNLKKERGYSFVSKPHYYLKSILG